MSVEQFHKFLFDKKLIITIGFILVFLVLRTEIEAFFSITLVKHFFSEINTAWYNDIIFLILSLWFLTLSIVRFRNYIPSKYAILITILITIYYLMHRNLIDVWNFTSSYYFEKYLNYTDIIIVIALSQLSYLIPNVNKSNKTEASSFIEDMHLGRAGIDELGYSGYAHQLAKIINNTYNQKAIAIGINGRWGLGKTSFIDLVKRNLNKDSIQLDFNPWLNQSTDSIVDDFFMTLQNTIKYFHSQLPGLFAQYSSKLLNSTRVKSQIFDVSLNIVPQYKSIISLRTQIDKALKKINRRIIVFIDDLDRLDKREILEVIRLIRNTANFNNIVFVVAYDRNFIINALDKHNDYRKEEFLEKIFQIEITLPYFNKKILRYKLAENLKNNLFGIDKDLVNKEIIGSISYNPAYLDSWLDSIRDVNRLTNAMLLNYERIEGEVIFNEFIRLEILRLKYPAAYEILFRRHSDFLEVTSENGSKKNFFQLIKGGQEKEIQNVNNENKDTFYRQYLHERHHELSIPTNEIPRIAELVEGVFQLKLFSINSREDSHLSIIYPSKFHRYFTYSLVEGELSNIEFSKARNSSQQEFNSKIAQWVKQGLELDIKEQFEFISNFDNKEDFEKTIAAIFYFANLQSQHKNDRIGRNIVGYDADDLMNKLNNAINYYYSGKRKELKDFLDLLLWREAEPTYHFESEIIFYFNKNYSNSFPLSKNELKDLSIAYLKAYCSKVEILNNSVWQLFYKTKQFSEIQQNNNIKFKETIPEEARYIMKKFILNKDLKGFLSQIIVPHNDNNLNKYSISDATLNIFDSWEDLKEQIENAYYNNIDNYTETILKEFLNFLDTFMSKKYGYIDFQFEKIRIDKRQ